MDKCHEQRQAWRQAQTEVEEKRKALKAADREVFNSVNTPETWARMEKLEADLKAAENRLKETEKAYQDCMEQAE